MKKELELYIHIPFCVRKCNYCAFLSFASDKEMRKTYTAALIRELEIRAHAASVSGETCQPAIETVYFGGGTPSVMETELTAAVMDAVRAGQKHYDMIEVMACPGGCVMGGGQPTHLDHKPSTDRAPGLYAVDSGMVLKKSNENPLVDVFYNGYFKGKAHELLHNHHE